MRKILFPALFLVVLAVNHAHAQQNYIYAARETCRAYGFVAGTSEFARCVMQLAREAQLIERCKPTLRDIGAALSLAFAQELSHNQALSIVLAQRGCGQVR